MRVVSPTGQLEAGQSSDLKSSGGFSPKSRIYGFANRLASSYGTAEEQIGGLDVWSVATSVDSPWV